MAARLWADPVVPVARWSFEEDARDTIGGLHATAEGAVGFYAGELSLGEGAVLRTPPVPVALGDMTVHAEVRFASLGAGSLTVMEIRSLDGKTADLLQIHSAGNGNALWRVVSQAPWPVFLTPPFYEANTTSPVYLTAVHTAGGGVTVYRDGSPIGTFQTVQTNGYAAGGARVTIGPRTGSGFDARIGDVALFDRALSAAEVIQQLPALEVRPVVANEASGVARVTLLRVGPVGEPLRIRLQTRDGGARAGVDYLARDLRVEFAAGERVRQIEIPLINDDLGADSRAFEVVFSEPEPLRRVPSPAVVWIQDDDERVNLVGEVDGEHREGGRVTVQLTRTGSLRSERRFQVGVRLVPTEPDALVQPARPGIDLARTEHAFEFGPGITNLMAEFELPDDREADGLRGFRVEFESEVGWVEPRRWGWPGMPFSSEDSWQIAIGDNEHELLGQEVAIVPYVKDAQLPMCLRNGETLILGRSDHGETLRWFGADGMPRADMVADSPLLREGIVEGVLELADGRLMLRGFRSSSADGTGVTVLHRLMADGRPDPLFASGRPLEVADTFPPAAVKEAADGTCWVNGDPRWNGGETVLLRVSSDGTRIQRLEGGSEIALGPDGECWVWRNGQGVRRYRDDGTLDPRFAGWFEADVLGLLGVDRQGRCYVGVYTPVYMPDGRELADVVRILPDGSVDSGYSVSLDPRRIEGVRVLSNGNLLASIHEDTVGSSTLMEIRPEGGEIPRGPFGSESLRFNGFSGMTSIPGVSQDLLGIWIRAGGGGQPWSYSATGFLLPNGTVKGLTPGETSWAGGAAWTWNWRHMTRRLPWREAPRYGFARTGVFVSGDTAFLAVRRSGSTARTARLRGEWQERIRGEWVAGVGQTFEVEFAEGVADTVAAVRLPAPAARAGMREFRMRLVDTGAEDGADFGVCRVWALAPGIAQTNGLQLHPVSGPDLAMDAVLTGVTTKRGLLETSESLRGPWATVLDTEMDWSDSNAEISTLVGATNRWAMPVHLWSGVARFYRQR